MPNYIAWRGTMGNNQPIFHDILTDIAFFMDWSSDSECIFWSIENNEYPGGEDKMTAEFTHAWDH